MKGIHIEKEELRLSLFTGDKNIYVEKYKDSKTMFVFLNPQNRNCQHDYMEDRVITKSTAFLVIIGEEQWLKAKRAHSHLQ